MDRIEYEEWALKAIHEGRGVKVVKKGEDKVQEMIEVGLSGVPRAVQRRLSIAASRAA